MPEFSTPTDIGNRAAQHVGAEMIDPSQGFSEVSKIARQVSSVYGKLRQAELQRNTWTFATRRTALRPLDTTTMRLAPTVWQSGVAYYRGSIVDDGTGTFWSSRIQNNLNNQPQVSTSWEPYFGPLTVSLFDPTQAYYSGELVYTTPGDGTYRVYRSALDGNADNPATATTWDPAVTYNTAQTVTYLSVAYQSLIDLNLNQTPNASPAAWTTTFVGGAGSLNWLEIGGAEFPAGVGLTTLNIIYPIGAGPSSQASTKNVYRLPSNFLKTAPQDPSAGSSSDFGAPTNLPVSDWEYENSHFVTRDTSVIVYRFIADVQDVTQMRPLFCECLAARIAEAICEPMTNSTAKLAGIRSIYQTKRSEAVLANDIEADPVELPLDDFIACRA